MKDLEAENARARRAVLDLSLDNGATHLADFATTSDYGDFSNSSSLNRWDAFNAFYDANTLQTLSGVDLRAIDVLGFTQSGAALASTSGAQTSSVFTPAPVAASALGQMLVGAIS